MNYQSCHPEGSETESKDPAEVPLKVGKPGLVGFAACVTAPRDPSTSLG